MINNKPNIFEYATKELSQDAFLCWLFSYAIKGIDKDNNIKACAIDFLKSFIPELENEKEIFLTKAPEKQFCRVDVLLTVNDKYKIIIEDKTYTHEHDDQLSVYRNCIETKFPDYTVVGVYYKIGFQSDLRTIKENNYKYFGLKTICSILDRHIDCIDNDIFVDYYNYVKEIENDINRFRTLPINEWNWTQINAFFEYTKSIPYGGMNYDYGYVPNQSGGFYGMWIYNDTYSDYNNSKYELYLQCEFVEQKINICYKASTQEGSKIDKAVREHFVWENDNGKWINNAALYGFTKPQRYGTGKTVTIGLYKDDEQITDYLSAEKKINAAIDDFKKMIEKINNK